MTVTPSPQSVVSDRALEQIAFNLCSLHDFPVDFVKANERFARSVITEYLRAAPAPSSLAGGEVDPLVQRLAYGYAIMHTAICHMAGTSGASGRWYYDKANEAFGRVSPIHSITEESNPHVNGDYFSGLSDFLAALSPEAPEREGWEEVLIDRLKTLALLLRSEAGEKDGLARQDDLDAAEAVNWAVARISTLTPRHETPASEGDAS